MNENIPNRRLPMASFAVALGDSAADKDHSVRGITPIGNRQLPIGND
jgi:hypothetical protein